MIITILRVLQYSALMKSPKLIFMPGFAMTFPLWAFQCFTVGREFAASKSAQK